MSLSFPPSPFSLSLPLSSFPLILPYPLSLSLSLSLSLKAAGAYLYLLVSPSVSGSIIEGSLLFLLRHPQYSQTQWQLIEGSYKSFLSSLAEIKRIEIQTLFINCCMEWIKVHWYCIIFYLESEKGLGLLLHCYKFVRHAYITLMHCIICIY